MERKKLLEGTRYYADDRKKWQEGSGWRQRHYSFEVIDKGWWNTGYRWDLRDAEDVERFVGESHKTRVMVPAHITEVASHGKYDRYRDHGVLCIRRDERNLADEAERQPESVVVVPTREIRGEYLATEKLVSENEAWAEEWSRQARAERQINEKRVAKVIADLFLVGIDAKGGSSFYRNDGVIRLDLDEAELLTAKLWAVKSYLSDTDLPPSVAVTKAREVLLPKEEK